MTEVTETAHEKRKKMNLQEMSEYIQQVSDACRAVVETSERANTIWMNVERDRLEALRQFILPDEPDLLAEAREIAAKSWDEGLWHTDASRARRGESDDSQAVQVALAALKRGIEIGKAGK